MEKMIILPAIDLYDGKAVRLLRGDYENMTVYSEDPLRLAKDFKAAGAEFLHMVDLMGARDGDMPAFETVKRICRESGLRVEIGGGIRTPLAVEKYLEAGAARVIIGTAAVTDPGFLREMIQKYGGKIAVGVDIRDGAVAIRGWKEDSGMEFMSFLETMERTGVRTVIVTDISKDGAMRGTNRGLYRELGEKFGMDLIASGGVSSMEDVRALKEMGCFGCIIGKACYTGAIDLKEAIKAAKEDEE